MNFDESFVYFVLHKPAGSLSSRTDPSPELSRPTVYEIVASQGFDSSIGAVGRLDFETSGLLLFTNDSQLNSCITGGDLETGDKLTKTYRLTVGNLYEDSDPSIRLMERPLRYKLGEELKETLPAKVRVVGTWNQREQRCEREWQRRRRKALGISKEEDGRPYQGWLTEIEVCIQSGIFHQVRRLAKRSGSNLKIRHLERWAIGEQLSIESLGLEYGKAMYLSRAHVEELYRQVYKTKDRMMRNVPWLFTNDKDGAVQRQC